MGSQRGASLKKRLFFVPETWIKLPTADVCTSVFVLAFFDLGDASSIALSLDAGTYHVVYAFDDVDNGRQGMCISDPFDVS